MSRKFVQYEAVKHGLVFNNELHMSRQFFFSWGKNSQRPGKPIHPGESPRRITILSNFVMNKLSGHLKSTLRGSVLDKLPGLLEFTLGSPSVKIAWTFRASPRRIANGPGSLPGSTEGMGYFAWLFENELHLELQITRQFVKDGLFVKEELQRWQFFQDELHGK